MREGKIGCIIVKDFSRFGQNSLEVGYFVEVQAAVSIQLSQLQSDEKTKSANKVLARNVMDVDRLNSELVDMLIERVYVYPGREIEIV